MDSAAGVGVRVDAIGLQASDVRSTSRVSIHDNLLVNNRFAVVVHAGFPDPDTQLKGDVDLRLGDNVMRQSCQANLLVALSRHATLVLDGGVGTYLMNSSFRINLAGDVRWQDVWYGNPAGYGNKLIVDGRLVPTGPGRSTARTPARAQRIISGGKEGGRRAPAPHENRAGRPKPREAKGVNGKR